MPLHEERRQHLEEPGNIKRLFRKHFRAEDDCIMGRRGQAVAKKASDFVTSLSLTPADRHRMMIGPLLI